MLKKIYWLPITVFTVLIVGFLSFCLLRGRTQTSDARDFTNNTAQTPLGMQGVKTKVRTHSEDPWHIWLEEQTDISVRLALASAPINMPGAEIKKLREKIRKNLQAHGEALKKESDTPPPLNHTPPEIKVTYNTTGEIYTGPQTAEALLETFYNSYGSEDSRQKQDQMYPPHEWLQMILNKGVTINNYSEFSGYMAIRSSLGMMREHVQNNPSRAELKATLNNLPSPIEHWETFETAYINKKIAENQRLNEAMRNNPDVIGGIFTGTNKETFLPLTPNRVYVSKGETGASFMGEELSEQQKFNLLFRGIEPDGYEIIYLDSDRNTLSEKPKPFKREDFANYAKERSDPFINNNGWDDTGRPETQDSDAQVPTEEQQNHPFDRAIQAKNEANAHREQNEKARQAVEKYATMTDAEIEAEFEKLLSPPSDVTPESIETELQKRLTPKHITESISLLNRYGPEEGLRRIKEIYPETATQIERILLKKEEANQ